MKPARNRSRRRFIKELGLGLASVWGWGGAALATPRVSLGADPVARIVALSADRERARCVGRALLTTRHRNVSKPMLLNSILGGDWRKLVSEMDDAALLRRLTARRREDFAAQRVATFDGWILTQSDIDYCILAALE
jgi:hypothetical protein